MIRTNNPEFLEAIANHPEVRPWLGGDPETPVRLAQMMADPNTYALVNHEGGFLVHQLAPGQYECHTIYHPGHSNPRDVIRTMQAAFEFMFVETNCVEVVTRIHAENERAAKLADIAGFIELFTRNGVSFRNVTLDMWAGACSTRLAAEGELFHAQIGQDPDPKDVDRNVRLGLCAAMLLAGNTLKGLDQYNRWALQAGEPPMVIHMAQPLTIQYRENLFWFRGGIAENLNASR